MTYVIVPILIAMSMLIGCDRKETPAPVERYMKIECFDKEGNLTFKDRKTSIYLEITERGRGTNKKCVIEAED